MTYTEKRRILRNTICVKIRDVRRNTLRLFGICYACQKHHNISYTLTYIVNLHVSLSDSIGGPMEDTNERKRATYGWTYDWG